MKNKAELKSWFEDDKLYDGEYVKHKINQLDEPEVLSEEWIYENMEDSGVHYVGYYVPIGRLHYLLVPKSDEPNPPNSTGLELPMIPEHVAEYLDFAKSDTTLMRVLELANTRNEWEKWEKEYDWIEENHELFARAWLDGYEVEEEQKYVLPVGGNHALCKFANDAWGIYKEDTDKLYLDDDFKFTEREIKDYDERFWPFAVKAEEMEE